MTSASPGRRAVRRDRLTIAESGARNLLDEKQTSIASWAGLCRWWFPLRPRWLILSGKPQPQRTQRWDSFLGAVDVGAGAEEDFCGLHDGFGKCGMRMNGECDVFGDCAHFDGENAFGDQFAGACSHDADAQHAFCLGID